MALLDRLSGFLSLGAQPQPAQLPDVSRLSWHSQPELIQKRKDETQTRAIDSYTSLPGLEAQLLQIQGLTDRPWRYPGINEALGTPAIFRAVSLISNTTGSLAVEAYRRGVKLDDDETPRVIKRPDPFRIPRDFYRDTAYYMATRGEYWWWVGARDTDGLAMSLICVPPWEITIQPTDDRLRPKILWLNREMRREDMRHGTFLPDDTGYRGVGPLQLCGAAISVAVEAQEWAANFYAEGGYPSIIIKSATELGQNPDATQESEADALRTQWMARDHNTPRVIDPGIESVDRLEVNEHGAQMLDARNSNNGDASRMFGIPGALMEYATAGSSLTYQNVAEVYTQFVRTTLAPNYLEPIEQELSDLLTRSTVARFNVKGFMRADPKTRAEIYNMLVPLGVMSAETAAAEEGYLPGDVEFAPIPFSEPSAIPTRLPVQLRTVEPVRCDGKRMLKGILRPCNKLLAESGSFTGSCPRCGKLVDVKAAPVPVVAPIPQTLQPLMLRSTPRPVLEVVPQAPPEPTMREVFEALPALIAAAIPRQEAPVVNFHERAINVEAPPAAQMTIAEGAIHVDNHVAAPDMSLMPAAQMTIAEGAIHVDVAAPDMSALGDLTAAFGELATRAQPTPQVTIAEGAIQTTVNVPPPEPEPVISSRVVKDADGNITITRSVA